MMRRPVSTRWYRWATWVLLALVALTGCAVFRSAKAPAPAAQAATPPAPTPAPVAETAPAPAAPTTAPPAQTPPPTPRAEDPRVPDLERIVAALRAELTEIRGELDAMRRVMAHQMEVAELRAQLDTVRRASLASEGRGGAPAGTVRNLGPSVGALSPPVSRGEAGTAPPKVLVQEEAKERTPKPPANPVSLPPQALYDRGMASLRQKDYGQAVVTFEELVHRHPSHALVAPAQFWIGEAYFRSRDYRHAVSEYQKAVHLAQRGEKTPEALYKMGLAQRALKRPDRAREAWTQLVREFPQSPSAERARVALRELPRTAKSGAADGKPAENKPI